jgi:hypothetical protein
VFRIVIDQLHAAMRLNAEPAAAAAAGIVVVIPQVHIEVLRLLLGVCKDVVPATLANYLGHMLRATAASRARASSQKKKFATISSQHGSQHAFGLHGVPGYIAGGRAVACLECFSYVLDDVWVVAGVRPPQAWRVAGFTSWLLDGWLSITCIAGITAASVHLACMAFQVA